MALKAKQLTESEIALTLNVSQATVSRDLQYLKNESRLFVDDLARDLFGYIYQECLEGMDQVCRKTWLLYHDQSVSPKIRVMLLALLKQIYESKFRMTGEGPSVLSVKRLGEKVERVTAGN